jgi:Amidohydrolase
LDRHGHVGPPSEVYRDFLDPAFREAFDAHQVGVAAVAAAGRPDNTAFVEEWNEETGDHDLKAGYAPDVRDAILGREGVVAEVLFPDADVLGTGRLAASPFGSGLGSGSGVDPANVRAGARAHNRWLADFCATNPHRRIGVAVVPITAGGVVVGGPPLLGARAVRRVRAPPRSPLLDRRERRLVGAGHRAADEREVGRGAQHPQVRGRVPPPPADAARRLRRPNCFFAASTPGVDEIDRRHAIGVDNLLWGNDLPHPEGTYPHTRKWIAERFRDVPEDETAKILGETAARLYRVDVAAVADIVDRIGPSRSDVHG